MQYPEYCSGAERTFLTKFVNTILAKGHRISVHDGEEYTVRFSDDSLEIRKAMLTADIDNLVIRDADKKHLATFSILSCGNENAECADECILDYSGHEYADAILKEVRQ
jgi:hypothetical protein